MFNEAFAKRQAQIAQLYIWAVWLQRVLVTVSLLGLGYAFGADGAEIGSNSAHNTLALICFYTAMLGFLVGRGLRAILASSLENRLWDENARNPDVTYLPNIEPPLPIGGPVFRKGATTLTASSQFSTSSKGQIAQIARVNVCYQVIKTRRPTAEPAYLHSANLDFNYDYIVLTVEAGHNLPHLFIDGRSQNGFAFDRKNMWSLNKKLRRGDKLQDLEGDFYKHFNVYAADKKQIEALSILTPDTMLKLRDQGYEFDYEIHDRWLHIIHEPNIRTVKEFEAFFKAMQGVMSELIPQLSKQRSETKQAELLPTVAKLGFWEIAYSARLVFMLMVYVIGVPLIAIVLGHLIF